MQKKCLVASATMHGLLLVVFLLASAFLAPQSRPFDLPLLDVIPARLVDAAIYGGGDPEAQPPPPAPAPPQPEPKPAPRPDPAPRPAPKPAPKPPTVTTQPPKPTPTPSRPQVQVSREVRRVTPAPQPARADTQQRAADQIAQRMASTASRLSERLSSKTTIGIPGPGGEAFANYGQVVISVYERAWIKPENIDRTFVVRATVVIARDGRVVSARITQLSGNRLVDDSVERVLDRVKTIAPFPEGTTDATRSFNLNFELKPGALTG